MDESKGGESGCGKGKCCGVKALIGILLLGVGWAGGYFCGRHCGGAKMCPTETAAPANPAK